MNAPAFTHGDWTSRVSFLDGGRLLASAGDDGVVRCWSRDGALARSFGDPSYSSCHAVSGSSLIAGYNGDDGSISLWDAATGARAHRLSGHPTATAGHDSGANTAAAALSPSGRLLASGGFDDHVRLWSTATGAELRALSVGDLAWSLAWSADEALVAVGTRRGLLAVWSVAEGRPVAEGKASRGAVTSVAFTPSGAVVSGGGKGEVSAFRVEGKKLTKVRDFAKPDGGGVEGLAVSPDGRLVAAASRKCWLRAWAIETGVERRDAKREGELFLGVAFSPDGARLAAAGPSPILFVDLDAG